MLTMILLLQERWLTGRASTSTSSSPAPRSLSRPAFSSSCLSACWIGGRRSVVEDRRNPRGGLGPTWLLVASTRASPQRATKRRRLLPQQRVPPPCEHVSAACAPWSQRTSRGPFQKAGLGENPNPKVSPPLKLRHGCPLLEEPVDVEAQVHHQEKMSRP